MHIIKRFVDLKRYLKVRKKRSPSQIIGFVPTMGALHEGHLSLIKESCGGCDISICSIFVNPTQFGESNDLKKYPKPIEKDIELLINNGCDVLFLPSVEEVYPATYTHRNFDLGGIDLVFEGKSRVGHFQGVCNVIYRFFDQIKPHKAYFGQKDFQQTVVVKKLVNITSLNTKICVVPIKRELGGLAMSSRNIRLSDNGRKKASFINESLKLIKNSFREIGLSNSVDLAKKHILKNENAKLDYLVVAEKDTLKGVKTYENKKLVILIAVNYEGVRLLDNIILD
ncbi:MAG: pantoate--beta-alanine ligase [Bacteroidia bacterium]|nr:pantoate--beta-alanine ligase [Bacteroidia bacterium]|tara:strand:+ start:38371 stop:39219 length:849 start_codon:yes stop_codon:yes gene_type:complete